MIGVCRFLAIVFGVLALVALGHDVWRAVSIENRFTLSEVGGLFMMYAPDAHDAFRSLIADTFGAKFFNAVFVPIFSLYTLVLTTGLAAVLATIMLVLLRRQNKYKTPGRKFRHRAN